MILGTSEGDVKRVKNKKLMFILIFVGIVIAILCVCCSLHKKDTNPFKDYDKIENETDVVPFPTDDEDEANTQQTPDELDKEENKDFDKVDSGQSTKDNVTNSDETVDNDEQDSESNNTSSEDKTELPFVPFD